MLENILHTSPFKEHPVTDITTCEPHPYEITALDLEHTNFIQGGKFSLEQYCHCLLNKILSLERSEIKAFLLYQCEQVRDAFTWINKVERLIDLNRELLTNNRDVFQVEKALMIIELIREDIQKGKFIRRYKFNFEKVKTQLDQYTQPEEKLIHLYEAKTEYLQNRPKFTDPNEIPFDEKCNMEIEKIERVEELRKRSSRKIEFTKPHTGKKIIIRGHLNILVDAFYQMLHEKKADGQPYLDANATSVTEFIVNNFLDRDGQPLSESTVRTILSPNKAEKRPKGDTKIHL